MENVKTLDQARQLTGLALNYLHALTSPANTEEDILTPSWAQASLLVSSGRLNTDLAEGIINRSIANV